jgi:hypothetical protein
LTDGKAVQRPSDSSTSVRVRAEARGTIENGEVLFTVEITPEPKVRGAEITAVRIKKAVDNAGQNLEPVAFDRAVPPIPFAEKGELPDRLPDRPGAASGLGRADPGLFGLKKGPKAATSLGELSGTITIRVPPAPEAAGKALTLDVPFTLKNVPLP